jgi:hypothetical protein
MLPKLSKFTLLTSQGTLQICRRVSLVHLTTLESISEPWHEDDCEAVEGVMAGPEDASQGNKGLLREIILVVKAVRTAVSEIFNIKSKVSEIEKSVQDLLSYSRTLVLCSGQSPTKDAASLEEQIAQQLMPANSLFSTEYVTAAVCSSLPQFLFKQDKDFPFRKTLKARRYCSHFLFSLRCRMKRRRLIALRLVTCIPI